MDHTDHTWQVGNQTRQWKLLHLVRYFFRWHTIDRGFPLSRFISRGHNQYNYRKYLLLLWTMIWTINYKTSPRTTLDHVISVMQCIYHMVFRTLGRSEEATPREDPDPGVRRPRVCRAQKWMDQGRNFSVNVYFFVGGVFWRWRFFKSTQTLNKMVEK